MVGSENAIFSTLRTFLLGVLGDAIPVLTPDQVPVDQTQLNYITERSTDNFVVMTPTLRTRLSTNKDTFSDVAFIGSINGTTLTVTQVQQGVLAVGIPVLGSGALVGTRVSGLLTGTGGVGTYTVNQTQQAGAQQLAGGVVSVEQSTRMTVQLDVHGSKSADYAQIISTLLRSEYAVEQFDSYGFGVVPLYASDPRQMPFMNAQQGFESRWTVDAEMQVRPSVAVPQQAAAELHADLKATSEFAP